jgi:putative transposase
MNFDRTFFVTTVTAMRQPIFRHAATANLLIETLAHYRNARKFLLHEFVVMPDHVHLLITPGADASLEKSMQFIKGGLSYRLHSCSAVWQPSFTNHRVRDFLDYQRHRDYIWLNPVRARLVREPDEYSFSSASRRGEIDPIPQATLEEKKLA